MSRVIEALLDRAADEAAENHGRVLVDTQAALAAEGYMLSALRGDVNRILSSRRDF